MKLPGNENGLCDVGVTYDNGDTAVFHEVDAVHRTEHSYDEAPCLELFRGGELVAWVWLNTDVRYVQVAPAHEARP